MKMPDTVKIGYASYHIEDWDGIESYREAKNGDYDFEQLNIRIGNSSKPPVRAAITIHEVFHGIVQHFNVPVGDMEEEIVTAFAEGAAQVIRDNPELCKWIIKALNE